MRNFTLFMISAVTVMSGIAQTPAPDLLIESNQVGAIYGNSVGHADVNGDGYDDMIVGAYLFDNGQTNEGVVYIYHGSSSGISAVPTIMLEQNQANSNFGYCVGSAGDVNSDGYEDILIGAYLYDNGQTDEGRAYVYHGSSTGINATPAAILEVDQLNAWFGFSAAKAGDVNGDGYGDVIFGALFYNNGIAYEGGVFVYHGSASGINTTPAAILSSGQYNAQYAHSISTAGDVNGDGYDDIIVGVMYYANGQTEEGAAFVYSGSSTGINTTPSVILESNQYYAYQGWAVTGGGDVNGDGFDDVMAAAAEYDNGQYSEGAVFVYHGSVTGINPVADVMLEENQEWSNHGTSLSTGSDLNNDGFDDLVVGTNRYADGEINEGHVFIYHGSADGISPADPEIYQSDYAFSYYGRSVDANSDLNGDGAVDLIVGAMYYDNGQSQEGAAYIYYQSACVNTYYADADGDGFGDADVSVIACSEPDGYVGNNEDCNDANIAINPSATELCNSIDDNCNGLVDDGIITTINIAAGGPTTFCQGGSVLLTATHNGTSLQWKRNGVNVPGATSTTYTAMNKGNYSCQTTSVCGSATSTVISVVVNKLPPASITAGGPTTFCPGGSVILTEVPSPGCTYQWYKGANPIVGATTNVYTATMSGNFKCRVTKTATGCSKNSNTITVDATCRIGDANKQFTVMPNPVSGLNGVVRISIGDISGNVITTIVDGAGKIIYSMETPWQAGNFVADIPLNNMPAGLYIITCAGENSFFTSKMIVE